MDGKTVRDTAFQAGDHAISYSEIEKKYFAQFFPQQNQFLICFVTKKKIVFLLLSITSSQLIVGLFHRLNVIIIWCQT